MKNLFYTALLVCLFSINSISQSLTEVELRANTPILLELSQPINSKNNKPNSTIDLRVRHEVRVNDKVVIPYGTMAKGQVTMAEHARGCGREGIIEIKATTIQLPDGTVINVNSSPLKHTGKNKKGLAWGLSVGGCFVVSPLSFFFLLIKGNEAEISQGTSIDTYTIMPAKIKVY